MPLILAPVVFSAKYGDPIPLFLQKHVNRKLKTKSLFTGHCRFNVDGTVAFKEKQCAFRGSLPQVAYVFKMAYRFDRSHCNKLKSGVPR